MACLCSSRCDIFYCVSSVYRSVILGKQKSKEFEFGKITCRKSKILNRKKRSSRATSSRLSTLMPSPSKLQQECALFISPACVLPGDDINLESFRRCAVVKSWYSRGTILLHFGVECKAEFFSDLCLPTRTPQISTSAKSIPVQQRHKMFCYKQPTRIS